MLRAYLLGLAFAPVAVMVDKPVTIAVATPEPVRHAKTVLLRIEGVVARRDVPWLWNVFWDLPEADAQTSVENIHFVGYVALPANSALRDPRPANFNMQLPEAAVAALRLRNTLRFTFVPLRKPPPGGVTITLLRLE